MPTDIQVIANPTCERLYSFKNEKSRVDSKKNGAVVKSGFLVLHASGRERRDVRVVVYRTSLEHFAVIYPRKRVAKPIGVMNLRNTSVQADSHNGFVVRQKGYDDTVTAKFVCERELDSWMSAFECKGPHALQTCLPVLLEAEE